MYIRRSWSVLLSHLAVRYPDVKCRRTEFRRWNVGAWNSECEMSADARLSGSTPFEFPQEDMWCAPLSGLPQGEAHGTREHHTRMIAYPIRICCPDHWLSPSSDGVSGLPVRTSFALCIPDLLMAKDFKASILHVSELSIVLPWIPKNSPQSLISLVIKKLSKHQNLTQFD